MRKLLVLAALSLSFAASAQTQVDAPGKKVEANPQQDRQAPQGNQQAPASKTEEERIRADGAAGGTKPIPPDKRQAVGAGAGPHKRDHQPSPERLPADEPVTPAK
jgi:hypothetical protein